MDHSELRLQLIKLGQSKRRLERELEVVTRNFEQYRALCQHPTRPITTYVEGKEAISCPDCETVTKKVLW